MGRWARGARGTWRRAAPWSREPASRAGRPIGVGPAHGGDPGARDSPEPRLVLGGVAVAAFHVCENTLFSTPPGPGAGRGFGPRHPGHACGAPSALGPLGTRGAGGRSGEPGARSPASGLSALPPALRGGGRGEGPGAAAEPDPKEAGGAGEISGAGAACGALAAGPRRSKVRFCFSAGTRPGPEPPAGRRVTPAGGQVKAAEALGAGRWRGRQLPGPEPARGGGRKRAGNPCR